eukprot:GHVL01035045.1.p1 GENE.GHVL01035045.1~~GHVL01035045.1.p1  ORF type:complete len:104 (-),score=11.10 GHVL01035045.1:34-345(-)
MSKNNRPSRAEWRKGNESFGSQSSNTQMHEPACLANATSQNTNNGSNITASKACAVMRQRFNDAVTTGKISDISEIAPTSKQTHIHCNDDGYNILTTALKRNN